jgi:hypothetical protein
LSLRFLPQAPGFQRWIPTKPVVSAVISALHRLPSCRESLQDEQLAPPLPGTNGSSLPVTWASIPFSKPSKTKFLSYKSSPNEFIPENLQPTAVPSSLDRLKITYGALPRRSSTWGPVTPASTPLTPLTSGSSAHSKPGRPQTQLHSVSNPSPSRSFGVSPCYLKPQTHTFQFSVPQQT